MMKTIKIANAQEAQIIVNALKARIKYLKEDGTISFNDDGQNKSHKEAIILESYVKILEGE